MSVDLRQSEFAPDSQQAAQALAHDREQVRRRIIAACPHPRTVEIRMEERRDSICEICAVCGGDPRADNDEETA